MYGYHYVYKPEYFANVFNTFSHLVSTKLSSRDNEVPCQVFAAIDVIIFNATDIK